MTLINWKKGCKREAALKKIGVAEALHVLDALLMHQCGLTLEELYSLKDLKLSSMQLSALNDLWQRFLQGEPLAYLLGSAHFWEQRLYVDANVLIPRADSECLVENVLAQAKLTRDFPAPSILELGIGSGALSLAVASELPNAKLFGLERSLKALAIAQQNSASNQIKNVEFFEGDWWDLNLASILARNQGEAYALIFSNPPYVSDQERKRRSLSLVYEPSEALFSEERGFKELRQIIKVARNLLLPSGWLLLEHGHRQGAQVRERLEKEGYGSIETVYDLNRKPRVTFGQWIEKSESLG